MEIFKQIAAATLVVTYPVMSFFGFVSEKQLIEERAQFASQYQALEEKVANLEERLDLDVSGLENILGAYSVSGGSTYRLRASVGTTDTTLQLSSFKEPVSGIAYTMSYLNTTVGYGTIDPQTTRSEFVSFTGITQNSDGTAALTGVTRGLTRTPAASTCIASTTLAQRHPGQSIFILSDSPCHFAEYAVKRNDETVSGQWTFPYPSASSSVATKGYVDNVALGNPTVEKIVVTATAGETVSAGNVLYQKISDGEWYKVDTDVSESTRDTLLGIAQGNGSDGVAISGGVLVKGLDSNQSGLSIGANYFISSTAGSLSTATSSRIIGRGRTTTSLYFDPDIITYAYATSSVPRFGATSAFDVGKNIQVITASSSFAVPTGIERLHVIAIGGGGGGGGVSDNYCAGGGGGSGGYAERIIDVSGTTSINVILGGAGAGGTSNTGFTGRTGGSTQFSTFLTANGGVGGGGTSVCQLSSVAGGAGGSASGGTINITGQAGGNANGTTTSGMGGSNPYGFGGPETQSETSGAAGTGYGAGGSGGVRHGSATGDGGAGTTGAVIIRW